MAKKTPATIALATETRENVAGLVVSMFVPFEGEGGFRAEKAGNKYSVPVKARDAEGKILKDGEDNTLYALTDGGTTATPFEADGRTIRKGVQTEQRQATSHMDFSKRVTDASVIFPDGKIRTVAIDLKANNPLTPEEFEATKTAATTTRKSKLLSDMSYEELMEAALAKKNELDAK
jgi:hypothetical protein